MFGIVNRDRSIKRLILIARRPDRRVGRFKAIRCKDSGDHTRLSFREVPPALERHGLGTKLAHAALEYARQNELTVVAICPFVQEYVANHPEYQSFVTTSVA